jgi:hypothetical protein
MNRREFAVAALGLAAAPSAAKVPGWLNARKLGERVFDREAGLLTMRLPESPSWVFAATVKFPRRDGWQLWLDYEFGLFRDNFEGRYIANGLSFSPYLVLRGTPWGIMAGTGLFGERNPGWPKYIGVLLEPQEAMVGPAVSPCRLWLEQPWIGLAGWAGTYRLCWPGYSVGGCDPSLAAIREDEMGRLMSYGFGVSPEWYPRPLATTCEDRFLSDGTHCVLPHSWPSTAS